MLGFIAYVPTFQVESTKPVQDKNKIADSRRFYAPYTALFRKQSVNTDIGMSDVVNPIPQNATVNDTILAGLKQEAKPKVLACSETSEFLVPGRTKCKDY